MEGLHKFKPCKNPEQPQGSPSNSSDLLGRMRGLEADHTPDGWPAVLMRDVSALCDEVEKARRTAQHWKAEHLAGNEEIMRLQASRSREGDRLDWLLVRLPGNVIRELVGDLSCTSDVAEWREKIDKAARF